MRIAVVGAAGRTGRHVVAQALARGHSPIAIARRPITDYADDPRVSVVLADALDRNSLIAGLAGADAVISTLGIGASRSPTNLYSDGTANIVEAMKANAIEKLAVVSALPAAPRSSQPFLERRMLMPILDRFFGATYDDMRRMEAMLAGENLDWVALRPPRLVDKPAKGTYRLAVGSTLPKARSLTFPDLATALLDSLEAEDLRRCFAVVAN